MDNHAAILNYKRFIKRLLHYSGIPYLILNFYCLITYCICRKPGTVILCYHSVNDLNNPKIFNPNIVETENFHKQMVFLRKHYNVISLKYYVENHKKLTDNKNVIITFDDGYKDNLTNAYPALQKYKLPATLFLATDFIDTGKAKFEDIITYIFSLNDVETIDLRSLQIKKTIKTKNERDAILAKICYALNKLDIDKSKEVVNELCAEYNIKPDSLKEMNDVMLTWDEIKQVDNQLMTIGAHSITHQNLTKLSHEQQVNEIVKSKSIIEQQLKYPITFFSYPLGFYDSNVTAVLKDTGYKCAVTTEPCVNDGNIDLFKLKRVSGVNNFNLFKFLLIRQSGVLYDVYKKLIRTLLY